MFPIMVSVRLELTLLSKTELPVEVGVKGSVVSKEVNNIKIILYKLEVSFFDIETKSETVFWVHRYSLSTTQNTVATLQLAHTKIFCQQEPLIQPK